MVLYELCITVLVSVAVYILRNFMISAILFTVEIFIPNHLLLVNKKNKKINDR